MKKAVFFTFLTLICAVAVSCNNDDDNNQQYPDGISGEWNLINVSNGFSGYSQDYERGEIVWDFNNDNTVHVENNSDSGSLLVTGDYNYDIHTEGDICDEQLEILLDDYYMSMGCITITGTTMVIDESYVDGNTYTFKR